MIGPCPHCGTYDEVYQAARACGKVQRFWDVTGKPSVVFTDEIYFMPYSDVVRCASCGHIRRDWQAFDGKLVRAE